MDAYTLLLSGSKDSAEAKLALYGSEKLQACRFTRTKGWKTGQGYKSLAFWLKAVHPEDSRLALFPFPGSAGWRAFEVMAK